MFEFCCSKNSKLGEINESRGVPHFRLHREQTNLENEEDIESLLSLVDMFKGADLWGSIPYGPWSPWRQKMCRRRYGSSYATRLKAKRKTSRKLLANYIKVAERVLQNGGHIAFEWPKHCEGWMLKELLQFVKKHNLYETRCDGCAFGLKDKEGEPHLKTWRITTSSRKLAKDLGSYRCQHPKDFKRSPLEGSSTGKSAFYTEEMAQTISNSSYPDDGSVPAMPTCPFVQSEHVPNEVPLGVHQLIDRRDWGKYPGADQAIKKELDGLLANEVWDVSKIISKEER